MDSFDPNRGCAKCGSQKPAKFEYHEIQFAECRASGEHMHRECVECGAGWAEAPLDAA
jgi:hypothetical protein